MKIAVSLSRIDPSRIQNEALRDVVIALETFVALFIVLNNAGYEFQRFIKVLSPIYRRLQKIYKKLKGQEYKPKKSAYTKEGYIDPLFEPDDESVKNLFEPSVSVNKEDLKLAAQLATSVVKMLGYVVIIRRQLEQMKVDPSMIHLLDAVKKQIKEIAKRKRT